MKTSTNLKFQIPELDDQANVTVIASALEALDDACGDALSMNGDASSAQVTFERASSRENITSRDTLGTIAAKLSRWLADIKDAAFSSVANNDSTTNSGYVLDARVGKTHGDEIDKLNTQVGGLYFGTNSAGKWGYKTSANGTVNPFRNPVGTAGAGDVLAGKTFANANSDSLTGTMPNQGAKSVTLTPTGNNTATQTLPAGYYSSVSITANGATAYEAGQISELDFCTVTSTANHGAGCSATCIKIPTGMTKFVCTSGSCRIYQPTSMDASPYASSSLTTVSAGSTVLLTTGYVTIMTNDENGWARPTWKLTK